MMLPRSAASVAVQVIEKHRSPGTQRLGASSSQSLRPPLSRPAGSTTAQPLSQRLALLFWLRHPPKAKPMIRGIARRIQTIRGVPDRTAVTGR
jgi:hypothetical protein